MSYLSSFSPLRFGWAFSLSFLLAACQTAAPPSSDMAHVEVEESLSEALLIEQAINSPVLEIKEEDVIESFDNLWDRLQAKFQLAEHYNHPAVDHQLSNYIDNQTYFDRIAERAQPFLFWIVNEIERRELPMELALIPIVESTFNPNAYSPKHAVGLWQFIGPTAKSFG